MTYELTYGFRLEKTNFSSSRDANVPVDSDSDKIVAYVLVSSIIS